MLPEGWRMRTVADVCHFQNGTGFGPEDWDDHGLPIIRIQNLNGGDRFDYYSGTPEEKWIVRPGQLLFAWAGTRGVSFGPKVWRGPEGVLNQHIFKVEPKGEVDSKWLHLVLRHVTDRIERRAHGFKATLLHVKKSDIEAQPIPVPPLDQQRRIATILESWEKAISVSEQLLAVSRDQKYALLRKCLQASRGWKTARLAEVATRIQRKSDGGDHPVLMISSGANGFVPQNEKYSRFMAGKSVGSYTLLRRGEFAYNKGNSKTYEFGCVYPLTDFEQGLVPHVYVCFSMDDKSCHRAFYKYLFEADYLHDQLGALVNTGVRNNGLLNIRPLDFLGTTIPIPPIEDQIRIAAVLDAASMTIGALKARLELLIQERAAVMQRLLTGKSPFQALVA
ncbi:MAG: restriction endonuclease subunit S [Pseudomonadota bacterium]|nr:restriction endonuclease subunit S [Pseudomonadota bacterium]